jgi:hypothetical protein
MRHGVLFQASMLGAGLIVLLLWGANWEWRPLELMPWLSRAFEKEPLQDHTNSPVTVMLVGDQESVAAIREAVHPDRIVASTPDGFALVEGRIIATSIEAASRPLNKAGWADRQIEIVLPPAPLKPDFPTMQRASAGTGSSDTVSALKDKQVLTPAETRKILETMDQSGDL